MTNFKQFLFLGVDFNYAEKLKSWVLCEYPNWYKAEQMIRPQTHRIRGHFFISSHKICYSLHKSTSWQPRNFQETRMMEDGVSTKKQFILRRRDWGIYQLINYFPKGISPQNTGFGRREENNNSGIRSESPDIFYNLSEMKSLDGTKPDCDWKWPEVTLMGVYSFPLNPYLLSFLQN